MSELAKSISKLLCIVTVKTGEDGKMFGTVTSGMVTDQLKTQFEIALDKRKIHLDQPIRALGEYEVELRLHPNVTSSLKVRVESSTPLPAPPVAAPAAEAKKEEHPRTEKRGRRPEPAGEKGAKVEKAPGGGERRPHAPRGEHAGKADHGAKGERPSRGPKEGPRAPKGPRPARAEKPAEGSNRE